MYTTESDDPLGFGFFNPDDVVWAAVERELILQRSVSWEEIENEDVHWRQDKAAAHRLIIHQRYARDKAT